MILASSHQREARVNWTSILKLFTPNRLYKKLHKLPITQHNKNMFQTSEDLNKHLKNTAQRLDFL